MRRTLSWGACLALLTVSPVTLALGLAAPQVRSSLDAPLQARLPLNDLGGLDPSLLKARLASASAFDEVGIPRTTLAESVKVAIERSHGELAVMLTTRQPVHEPYLDLLLTLEWPGGRQRQEVTLLLDPPGYAQMPALQSGGASAASLARSSTASGTEVTGASRSPASAPASPESLRVAPGDTLWGLASRVRPSGASLEQTMLALQDANPEAFPNGNVNNLRAGVTLNVPSRDAILASEPDVADRQIRAQTRQWQLQDAAETTVAASEGMASKPVSDGGETPSSPSRLSVLDDRELAAASSAEASRQPLSPAALAAALQASQATRFAELESQLQTTRQSLSDARAQRSQLAEQVDQLRAELSGLRDQLAAALAARREVPAASATSTVAPRNEAAAPSRGLLDWLSDNLPLLGGAAVALLLGLWAWLRRRERRQDSAETLATPFPPSHAAAAVDQRPVDEPAAVTASQAAPCVRATPSQAVPPLAADTPPQAEAISEAEIYMAYGRYDQARERLEQSLAHEPERQDLRLELLAACVALGDHVAAEREAAELEASGNEAQRREARNLLARLAPADVGRTDAGNGAAGGPVPEEASEDVVGENETHEAEVPSTSMVAEPASPPVPHDARVEADGVATRVNDGQDEPQATNDETPESVTSAGRGQSGEKVDDDERVIDYEPPSLEMSEEPWREPQLAQPVVDYPEDFMGLDHAALGEPVNGSVTESPFDAEQGWVVEEVAFDPLDLDNERSTASASSPDAERRLSHARQYLDDGEPHAARALLEPLLEAGDDEVVGEARALLDRHGL